MTYLFIKLLLNTKFPKILGNVHFVFRIDILNDNELRCVCIHTNKRSDFGSIGYVTSNETFFNETIKRDNWEIVPIQTLPSKSFTFKSLSSDFSRSYHEVLISQTKGEMFQLHSHIDETQDHVFGHFYLGGSKIEDAFYPG